MLKKVVIPQTSLYVSQLALGTADIGLRPDAVCANRLFDTFLDIGGNLIDTAHVYSNWVPGERARSERIIGEWIADSKKRNEIILMTKGGHPEIVSDMPNYGMPRLTYKDMLSDLEHSLQKLQTDFIDIYFYHRDDMTQSVEEEIETMEEFVKQGKIRYYGCSNWSAERMKKALDYCEKKGYRGFVADQSLFNLASKYMNPPTDSTLGCTQGEAFQLHIDHWELVEMPYFGNCAGYFHKYIEKGPEAVKDMYYDTEKNRMLAERVKKLAQNYNCSLTQVVMGYFRFQPFPCIPLYGTSSPEHLLDACKTWEIPFTAKDYEELIKG